MIKLCGKSIALSLRLIFLSILNNKFFPDDWKKSNIVPCLKNENKNLIKNYRLISLLPIFSKLFETLTDNSLENYFMQNKLFTNCQSGFMPGDSCVSQLLSVIHEIYKSFDCSPPVDVRGTFLDISKAFDNIWYDGLILKLQTYGIHGNLLKLLLNYFINRVQWVILNGQTLLWKIILVGVPKGSVFFWTIIVSNIYD